MVSTAAELKAGQAVEPWSDMQLCWAMVAGSEAARTTRRAAGFVTRRACFWRGREPADRRQQSPEGAGWRASWQGGHGGMLRERQRQAARASSVGGRWAGEGRRRGRGGAEQAGRQSRVEEWEWEWEWTWGGGETRRFTRRFAAWRLRASGRDCLFAEQDEQKREAGRVGWSGLRRKTAGALATCKKERSG